MSKICCVGDAGICPKSSSCSMVLRSACSHRHSRESLAVKEHLHSSSPRKSKHTAAILVKGSSNGTLRLKSLESSLKQLSLQSTEETHSVLNGQFYDSFEISKSESQKFLESSSVNISCAKQLHFSELSTSNGSSVYKNISHRECSSDYSSASECDMNSSESLNSTSDMSKSQKFTRSSVFSMRTLSGSEDEGDIEVKSISRQRRNVSPNYGNRQSFGTEETNWQYLTNNNSASHLERHRDSNSHLSMQTGSSDADSSFTQFTDSSHLDRSSVQYSLFDRFRWFLWRCTYLKIIRNVNFDVWLLSRLNTYGKHKATFFLLLPLLLFLVWCIFQHNPLSYESLFQAVSAFISSFVSFLSSIFSLVCWPFTQQEEVVTISEESSSCSLSDTAFASSLSSLFTMILSWFSRTGENTSSITKTEYHTQEPLQYQNEEIVSFQSNREEMKILASEILKDEINSLKEYLKFSIQETEADKKEKDLKLQTEIKNLRHEFQSLSSTMGGLKKDILKQSEKSETTENIIVQTNEYKTHIDQLDIKLKTIEAKLSVLERLKNCCEKQWKPEDFLALLEKHLILAFKNVVDADTDPSSKYRFFSEWLNSKFFSHEKLMQEINAALRRHTSYSENKMNFDNVIQVVESTVLKHVDSIKRNLTEFSRSGYPSFTHNLFSEDKIKKIVKEAIMLYDADKTGQVDYALESGGGSVLGTRCSETYVEKYGKLSIFGVPLWTNSNSPRTAIQPDVQPGRCWAFKGSQGFLVLELSATIYPTGFTLEHIPVSLSPSGSIDSAPKNFSVWGLDTEKDSKGYLLGEYWYDINGEPLQYFAVQKLSPNPYSYVELQIHSNHGNMEYTCLYRFRVHGKRVR